MLRAGLARCCAADAGMLLAGILLGIATPTEVAPSRCCSACARHGGLSRMDWRAFVRTVIDTAALTACCCHLRRRLGLLLDPDDRLSAAAPGRPLHASAQHRDLHDRLDPAAGRGRRAARGPAVAHVLAPLLLPIAGKLGLSEMHYALVLIIAMGSAASCRWPGRFYVCCAIMRCDIESASRAMLPYLWCCWPGC